MRQMVGLIQRRGIFYFRRTIPEALRADMPAVLAIAGADIFDACAAVSLKGSRAGREFWASLGTRDEDEARARARSLDAEADALMCLAKRRLALSSKPPISELDDTVIQDLVATFRRHKLANDEALRRGTAPLTSAEYEALGEQIAAREAELRDANARGDCAVTHFDPDAMRTVLDAGINIEFRSAADRRLYLAFVEAELDLMSIIKDRQSGETRPTPPRIWKQDVLGGQERTSRPIRLKSDAPTLEQIFEGWKIEQKPVEKTVYTFESKLRRWTSFLAERGASFHSASLSDASDWKIASLETRSVKSVANDIAAVTAIYSWALANGKCLNNPFSGLKKPRAATKGARKSTIRGFTDEEAVRVLVAARSCEGYRRWIPWIANYTGARISEICQLERSDVAIFNGVHFFRMRTESDGTKGTKPAEGTISRKSLKTSNAKRQIPIHPKLVEEGFLDFVSKCKENDIFADATPDRFGNRGGNATKVICRWVREKVKITDPDISPNHSFRHRFSTLCRNYGVEPEMRDKLMGHSRGQVSDLYGEGYWVSTLEAEIKKISSPSGLI